MPCVAGIVVVVSEGSEQEMAHLLTDVQPSLIPPTQRLLLTTGGATRRDSVLAGLKAIGQLGIEATAVAIHDGARPCLDKAWLEEAYQQLQQIASPDVVGICAGTKLQDTVKACTPIPPSTHTINALGEVRPMVFLPLIAATVDRTPLWQVQTPQLFLFSALWHAHHAVAPDVETTDDAQLIELSGIGSVVIKQSSPWNVKLTTWADYQLIQAILQI
jgi:2-C-methyl-D-erythritol 4-phosphate cytidylyltransferase